MDAIRDATTETARRAIYKAITWQTSGLAVMSAIGYAITGSFEMATGIALLTALLGAVMYVLHERIWNRISWGRRQF